MTICITDKSPDIHLTQAEYDRLMDEYGKMMMSYAGPYISFEAWVRSRRGGTTIVGAKFFDTSTRSNS